MTLTGSISGTPLWIDRTKEFRTPSKMEDPGRHERFVTVGEEGNEDGLHKAKAKTHFFVYQKSSEKGS